MYSSDLGEGVSAVTVRDIEGLFQEVHDALTRSPPRAVLLHVGLGRPGSLEVQTGLTELHAGFFATSGGRFGLPSRIEFQTGPVAEVSWQDFGRVSIYRAIGTWRNLDLGEPSEGERCGLTPERESGGVKTDVGDSPGEEEAAWIHRLRATDPDLFRYLDMAPIRSDEEYVHYRNRASHHAWHRIDQFRFGCVLEANPDLDPFNAATLLPRWIQDEPVSSPPFSKRLTNALSAEGIETVGQALAMGYEQFAAVRNLGRKSIKEFTQWVLGVATDPEALPSPPPIRMGPVSHVLSPTEDPELSQGGLTLPAEPRRSREAGLGETHTSLRAELESAAGALVSRDARVLWAWLGVGEEGPRTLGDIGSDLGVTRERVRQLRNRAWEVVTDHGSWAPHLREVLDRLLQERKTPLYLDLASAEERWLDGFQGETPALARLAEVVTESQVHAWALDDRIILSRASESEWLKLRTTARTVLEERLDRALEPREARLLIEGLARSASAPELSERLWTDISPELHFATQSGDREILAAVGRGLRHAVYAVLKGSDRPMGIREILRALGRRGHDLEDDQATRRGVRSALSAAGALRFGRSVYGLREHLPWDEDTAEELASELERILLHGPPNRQWHCSELHQHLVSVRPDTEDEATPFLVNILLSQHSAANYLGRLVWAMDSGSTATQDRLDIADLCEAVLEEAGRPLTKQELRSRIEKVRGLNENFLPQISDRVVRVARGHWGLVDRDLGVSRTNQKRALDALARALSSRGRGLHVTELFGALAEIDFTPDPELDESELLGIAQQDPRFRVGRGQLIGLSQWQSLRRTTLKEAFQLLRESMSGPVGSAQLHQRFCEIIEREIPRANFASRAVISGFVYDEESGTWDVASEEDDVGDEYAEA